MRAYNATGYALLLLHALVSALLAPPALGLAAGLLAGTLYLGLVWLSGGVYLSNVLHMGIAHGALHFRPWFVGALVIAHNAAAIYVNPTTWVNRHRHHHTFSDEAGDPHKRAEDGFWKTLYLCLVPYPCETDFARDPVFRTWPFRLVSNGWFAAVAQVSGYGLLWRAVGDWAYALALWCSVRLVALWANMVQNYWTHDRRFGTRRYPDEHDNAMNIGDWLPVTATFSACWQNNHHHHPHLLRLSHHPGEYDFGFLTVRALKALGLVEASPTGARLPPDVPLRELGF